MSTETILNLINEVMNNEKFYLLQEQKEGPKTVIKFPKFKINEKHWGKNLGTDDRAVIERIGAQLKGGDPLERVEYLQKFLTETEQVKSDITVGQVMGTLMFLDIFASVVFEFNASVAGFLFEALFAGIFEGFQIEAKEGGGEAGTTDVILNVKPKGKGAKSGVEYSFKLLSPKSDIKGSYRDLVDGISKSAGAQETYLIVFKSGTDTAMELNFYEYDVNQENWFDWVGTPTLREETLYDDVEFEFGGPNEPDFIEKNITGKVLGKIVDGKFFKPPTEAQSVTQAGNVSGRRSTYDNLPSEEVEVSNVSTSKASPLRKLGLVDEDGNIPSRLITGRKYKIKVPTGKKTVADFENASGNFKNLYADLVQKESFGPDGEDFLTYVGEGTYKTDPEFFDRLKEGAAYKGKAKTTQFFVNPNYVRKLVGTERVRGPARLVLDRDKFQTAADAYTELVGKQIFDIFTNLSNLIDDVSGYFLGVSANERNRFATKAKAESKQLAQAAEENLVEVPEGAPPTAGDTKAGGGSTTTTYKGSTGMGGQDESKHFDNQLEKLLAEVFKK